jgi:hypothetical protein
MSFPPYVILDTALLPDSGFSFALWTSGLEGRNPPLPQGFPSTQRSSSHSPACPLPATCTGAPGQSALCRSQSCLPPSQGGEGQGWDETGAAVPMMSPCSTRWTLLQVPWLPRRKHIRCDARSTFGTKLNGNPALETSAGRESEPEKNDKTGGAGLKPSSHGDHICPPLQTLPIPTSLGEEAQVLQRCFLAPPQRQCSCLPPAPGALLSLSTTLECASFTGFAPAITSPAPHFPKEPQGLLSTLS